MSSPFNRRRALAGLGSLLGASPLLQAQKAPQLFGEPPGRITPRAELVNVFECESVAERALDSITFASIAGSDRGAFDRITFRPRLMVNTLQLDLSVDLFGDKLFAPILIGPAAQQKRFHSDGELAMAKGAAAAKTALVVADRSSVPFESIAAEAKTPLWYQIYPEADASAVGTRVQNAVKAGAKAVCVTVGTPYEPQDAQGYAKLKDRRPFGNPALDWNYLDGLRQKIAAPMVIKGIMSPEEAQIAVERGFQGIVVSNHGGQFLTGLAHPITVLPSITAAVGGKVPVLVDGSFRRGSDILKALAFGARAVLVGRPPLWGLAAYGADGVQTVVEMLQTELACDMAMIGAPNLDMITDKMVKVHKR